MTQDSIGLTDDESALLNHVPNDGSTIGNHSLQRELAWENDRYWSARDALVDKKLISRGRGRGGTVRRETEGIVKDHVHGESLEASAQEIEAEIKQEQKLYEPMKKVIEEDWAKDHRNDPLAVEITALQGSRSTGGIWSRPDIVSIEVRTYEFLPGKFLEVVTFEVKLGNALNVTSVYEALAHRRFATRSYVLAYAPSDQASSSLEENLNEVSDVARSQGIGFVVASDPRDYGTWDERVVAQRVEFDPERVESFISTQLSSETRRRLSRRLR